MPSGTLKAGAHAAAAAMVILICAGCASSAAWSRYEMCFGLTTDSGCMELSQAQWQEFVDMEIIPRFPDGFTVYHAQGFWRSGNETTSEPSRIVTIVAPDNAETRNKLNAVADAYMRQFSQESVLQIRTSSRIEFRRPRDKGNADISVMDICR